MLYCGEQIGNGTLEPQVDIAVDPLDGTTSIALVSSCAGSPATTIAHAMLRQDAFQCQQTYTFAFCLGSA